MPAPILAVPETLNPVPTVTLPLTPSPPIIDNAPEVDEVEFALDNIATAPTNVDVPWIEMPVPILTMPDILNPVPPTISPLTPKPPTILKAPLVDEVAFVLERIETAPTRVEVPWTETPDPADIKLETLRPVPTVTLPETPKPPMIDNAPEVDDVELVLESIETEPTKVELF